MFTYNHRSLVNLFVTYPLYNDTAERSMKLVYAYIHILYIRDIIHQKYTFVENTTAKSFLYNYTKCTPIHNV